MQTVVELPEFIRCARKLRLSEDEKNNIIELIATDPHIGSEISGTEGMLKVRVAGKGKGKSGGFRVITFFSGPDIPAFLITIYGKSQKAAIMTSEKKTMKVLSNILVDTYKRKMK